MTRVPLYLNDCGVTTALGHGKAEVARALFAGDQTGIVKREGLIPGRSVYVGAVKDVLSPLTDAFSKLECRNNQIMLGPLLEIASAIHEAITTYGRDRIAVVLGTSTGGMSTGEAALEIREKTGEWPEGFDYAQHELSSLSTFTAKLFGLTGAVYTISTACSSSAKVFAAARRLIENDIADAAIIGGADTLCRMTLNGFESLGLLSATPCNPFSVNRSGITIGEGASAFLLSRRKGPVAFLGSGETSDAYHLTAPDPEGSGARLAMQFALREAQISAHEISYINLHGTATPLNDAMEAKAVAEVFGEHVPCSSTKGITGHMLGATGGCEAAFLWLTLNPATNPGLLPPHIWDQKKDPALPSLSLVSRDTPIPKTSQKPLAMLSNSFGFGGSNAAIVLGQAL